MYKSSWFRTEKINWLNKSFIIILIISVINRGIYYDKYNRN
jgi:hypothetical protein